LQIKCERKQNTKGYKPNKPHEKPTKLVTNGLRFDPERSIYIEIEITVIHAEEIGHFVTLARILTANKIIFTSKRQFS